ncbi:MAG: hypothetical protein ABSD13_11425 [Candidatus Korobacteraceae bacterium]|jgi:acetyltransferase-like isoleucine patch superfamily enzyme
MSLLLHNQFEKRESLLRGIANRVLQQLALFAPGASTLRIWLHRARGVKIGNNVFIGYDTIIDSSSPDLVSIGDDCFFRMRVMIIANFKEAKGVRIEPGAYIGTGSILLPAVVIGREPWLRQGACLRIRWIP